ncbi:MAG: hypothetical protein NW241_02330 [Bacteroidia bacterium]|nr:hypothetical protein [Bacteroidia bacterium]
MKFQPLFLIGLAASALILTGCPVGISFPLAAQKDAAAYDPKLEGTWACSDAAAEMQRVTISKGEAKGTYTIEVLERGELYALDTDLFTAWVTELEGRRFLVAKPDNENKFYHYCFEFTGGGELRTYDVGLKVGGVDAVSSVETFREEVRLSLKDPECLSSPYDWVRE